MKKGVENINNTGKPGLFRSVLDNMLEGCQIIGFDWRYLYVNEALARQGKHTKEEMLGHTMMEMYPGIDKTDLFQYMRKCLEERVSHKTENEFEFPDGSKGWFYLSLEPVPEGMMILSIDITRQKELEQERMDIRFRSLFEAVPGLFLVLKPDLTIVGASDAYLRATMTKREDIMDRGLFDVFPDNPDDAAADGVSNLRSSLDRVLRIGEPDTMAVQKYDVRRPASEGGQFEVRYWSPVNSPVFGTDKKLEYIIHRVEDVTEFVLQRQKGNADASVESKLKSRMESMESEIFQRTKELQRLNLRLQDANKELEAFSYSVSHDLRAPLRHIDGFADLLQKHAAQSLDEKGRRFLKTISESAKHMGMLIDDLLVFSRMGRIEMKSEDVDMQSLTTQVIERMNPGAERAIQWKIGPLPHVLGDRTMLHLVIQNLIDNAIKYTRKSTNVQIEIGSLSQTGEVQMFVKDNGVGFDMRYVEKLFGVFQRLHGPEEFEGTGIGLANVRRIVDRHHGRTWAEGEIGKGATVWFSLPIPTKKEQ